MEVEEILFRHDPIGINFEDNRDEYDPEVDTILPRLKEARDADDVQSIVYEEFVRWFDEKIAGKKSNVVYKNISLEIWEAWVKFSRPLT